MFRDILEIKKRGVNLVRESRFFLILFILLTAFPAYAAGQAMLQIEGVRYSGTGDKSRLVLDLNRKTDFRAFMLDNPCRVVLDLPKTKWKISKSRLLSDSIIKSYRSGELSDGLTRIVFDIRKTAVIKKIFPLGKNKFNKNRLVIDLEQSSFSLFTAQKDNIFGNRYLKGNNISKTPTKPKYKLIKNNIIKPAAPASISINLPKRKPIKQKSGKYTIIIDPGHGGRDPGAVSNGIKEKSITLAVSKELKRQLEKTGRYRVVMTRDKDIYIKLRERVNISRRKKGDLFISIHADKINRSKVRGASVYTLSEKASDAETAKLAENENNSGFIAGVDLSQETPDVADILLDLAMREKMNESNLFARILTRTLAQKKIKLLPNSHRSAGFAVLKAPDIPSILIETGFLSNPNEARLMRTAQFQRKISTAILEGINAYFQKMRSIQKP